MEDSRQSREHGVSLLVHRRKITADAAKSGDPSHTTKGARNLLLHFRPAKVPLGLVVRKRNAQVVEQSQHLLGAPEQRIQQILGLTLLAPTLVRSCGRGGWRRLSRIASRQNLARSARPIRRAPWREPRAGGADATRGMRHADRARSPVSPRPTTDAPARRLPHNRAPGGLHGYCEHSHSHHGWPVDRACLARHATPDGSGSEYSSHATNEASHTRGCQSHLHAGADWLQSARQCAQPSEPAARRPVCSTEAWSLPRSGTHRSRREPHRCEPWEAIAPGADTRPTLACWDHIGRRQ